MTDDNPTPSASELRHAIDVFQAFREADLYLWRRAAAALQLAPSAVHALAVVLRHHARAEGSRPRDVAAALNMSASGTSAVLDSLVEKGYIRREARAGDRRAIYLAPTEAALTAARAVDGNDAYFSGLMSELTESERSAFLRVIERMHTYVESQFRTVRGTTS